MFLKSLEIRGFKSFADKTELLFKDGITAIVGPNGSGKSNISDAVKWVLGEQNIKNLRGGKMQDVIFSGTEFRKPVGLAQVSLILDNTDGELPIDYNEVIITRRIFRSGESEYNINNTKCRLKDIQELFMDTGIGKEGYSIIGQGKIDAVLSAKSEDRRSILEEAAGIVKFKTRKEEAEKKLQNTEQNLQRINDIFSTYEERIVPLEIEKSKAKEFIYLSEKLKSKEVTLVLHNIENIEKKLKSINNNITEGELHLKELLNESNNYKIELEKLSDEMEKFELENNEEISKYYNSKSENQNLLAEGHLLNERISNLNNFIEKTITKLEELREKFDELNKEKRLYELEYKKDLAKQQFLNDEICSKEKANYEKNDFIDSLNKKLDKAKAYEVELLTKISQSKNEISIIKNKINSLNTKTQELRNISETYRSSVKINDTTRHMLSNEIKDIEDKLLIYEEDIKHVHKEKGSLIKRLQSNETKYKELFSIYNKMEANVNALINLEKHYEGYNKSVKSLMQHIDKGEIPEAIGKTKVLGDIIKVSKEMEVAIEIALGQSISNIITDQEEIAKRLIKYLKDKSIGRATFLPLNIIKSKKLNIPKSLLTFNGYIGVGSELIEYDNKYANAIEYVLGRTIIAKDMDSALAIAKETDYNFRIVTLTGEMINPGGALTGGSIYYKNANIIGRKREIHELKEKLRDYNYQINSLNKSINNDKEKIKALDENSINLKEKVYSENIEKAKIKEKIKSIEAETDKLKDSINTSEKEILLILKDIKENESSMETFINTIQSLDEKEKDNLREIQSLENQVVEESNEFKKISEEITLNKISKAQLDQNILNKNKEIQRIISDINKINSEIRALEKEIEASKDQINISQRKIDDNNYKAQQINQIILGFEDKFKDNDIKRIEIKESIKVNKESLDKVSILCEKAEKNLNSLQVSLARYETEKNVYYNKLNDEMELTYAEALEIRINDENIEQCKKDILEYKRQISLLGTVNLGAIEEYEALINKYNFMKTQKEDLTKAKAELINVVNEMTEKMRVVFNYNFNKLRKNFNETFRELFNGGSADLLLEEGDELTANIEINVQPPGKKLQNINLMSGGEKGLSAIALLFAILKMKPSPFCILDEIEAALDDSNVSRYAEFLRKFSNNTQFVIITHRKGSMEVGDVLYGVTMEEKGISKVISVQLNK